MDEQSDLLGSGETVASCYGRLGAIAAVILCVFCAFVLRLWQLQIVDGDSFRMMSENNRLRLRRIPPIRGLMYDRSGEIIVDNRPSFDVVFVPEDALAQPKIFENFMRLVPEVAAPSGIRALEAEQRRSFESIVIAKDVSWNTLVDVEAHQMDLPGISVEIRSKRLYTGGASAAHIFGYVGEVNEKEIDARSDYRAGDLVGKVGLERAWEELLRGRVGGQQVEVDASGKKLRVIDEVRAKPGHNLQLTIDIGLQGVVERVLGEAEGALVVLQVDTGEVLALANRPAFDPNVFAKGLRNEEWRALVGNPLRPLMNRALKGLYPPGSTVKPIMALAALEEGIVTPATEFRCVGGLPFGGRTFHCWKRSGHGKLDLKQALAQSCDVYFYQIGQRLGIQKIADYSKRFWLGKDLGLGLETAQGLIPDAGWKRRRYETPWYAGETLSVVIGQGYMIATPLQMAVVTAALANGGRVFRPMFVKHILDAERNIVRSFEPVHIANVDVAEEHLMIVREAMQEVVLGESGTGKEAALMDVRVAGKTGTAQVVSGVRTVQHEIPRHHRDHAWFVAFAPADRPEVAVVCLLEHAGKGGGTAAAPIVRKVLEAYFRLSAGGESVSGKIRPPVG